VANLAKLKSPGALSVFVRLWKLNAVCAQHLLVYCASRTTKLRVTGNSRLELNAKLCSTVSVQSLVLASLQEGLGSHPFRVMLYDLTVLSLRTIHDWPFHSTLYGRNRAVKQSQTVIIYRHL
jgi:hypothetical protein